MNVATKKGRQIVYCVVQVDGAYVVREMTTSQLADTIAADPMPEKRLDRDVFPTRLEAELRFADADDRGHGRRNPRKEVGPGGGWRKRRNLVSMGTGLLSQPTSMPLEGQACQLRPR
jgi:hypothetical protein